MNILKIKSAIKSFEFRKDTNIQKHLLEVSDQ